MSKKAFNSFRFVPRNQEVVQAATFLHTEYMLLGTYQRAWAQVKDVAEWARKGELVDWDEGKKIAAIEAAAYLYSCPQLALFARPTLPLYRLLRGAELSGAFKRGRETTLIGSDITIPEVLATHLYPPTSEVIEELHNHGTIDRLSQKISQSNKEGSSPRTPPLPFIPGSITAIEPDESSLNTAKGHKQIFQIPNKLHLLPTTLDKALKRKKIPQSDIILLNRADPRIFGNTKDDWARTLDEILPHIKSEGYFVLTVGTGNNSYQDYERNLRLDLLDWLSEILPNRGMQVTTPGGKANFVEYGGDDDYYYGGPYGMIGYIIGRNLN